MGSPSTEFTNKKAPRSNRITSYNVCYTKLLRVIAYIDTGTNIPIVPNGGDVTVAWDNGANKIFTL